MSYEAFREKLRRVRAGGKPRVLDLFSGCGGLSLGLQAAGFQIRAAVEFDPDAARSHGLNFHPGELRHAVARDDAARALQKVLREFGTVAALRELLRLMPPLARVIPERMIELAWAARMAQARDHTRTRRTGPELSR